MNAVEAAREIIENAAEWGWALDNEQDRNDAAYSYCNDSGDCTGWQEVADALNSELAAK